MAVIKPEIPLPTPAELMSKVIWAASYVEGINLRRFFLGYMERDPKYLLKLRGTLEEVMLARTLAAAKKKGLIEELESDGRVYHQLLSHTYALPCKEQEE
jgi:hypothetical protein